MNRFERLIRVHRLLQSPMPVPVQRFIDALECGRATVFRDFEYLRTFLDAPIVNRRLPDGSHGHYYDPDADRFELPGLWLNASELHALLVAEQLLESVQPGLLAPRLNPLKGRLRKLLGESGYEPDQVVERVTVRAHGHRVLEPDAFACVAQGVLEGRRLSFRYRSRSRDEERGRHVHPQRLVHYRSNWYLAAWCEDAEDLRLFSLDRIRDPQLGEGGCRCMETNVLNRQLEGSFGIFTGVARDWALLRFSPAAARWAAEESWHPDQLGDWDGDHYEVQVPYSDPTELILEVLRYGPEVEVLGPATLREEVLRRLRAAVGRYEDEEEGSVSSSETPGLAAF